MLVLTAAAMVAACSKDDRKPQTSFEVPEEGGAPQALVLTTNVKAAVEVKSQGGVDKWNAAQNLHVYGYHHQAFRPRSLQPRLGAGLRHQSVDLRHFLYRCLYPLQCGGLFRL